METLVEIRQAIMKAVTSEDSEARVRYLQHFGNDVEKFSEAMAKAFVNWRVLDDKVKTNERLGHVSALVFTAMTLHILSMKLFISGLQVASGNLFRQVVETMSLALLCSGKELDVLTRFMNQKYSTSEAVRDVNRQASKLGLNKDALTALSQAQKFYHNYSHPSMLTIATGVSFSQHGGLYIGASFDEGKLDTYAQEVTGRVSLAENFSNFIDGVKMNVSKWK
jgi:hypothetical protein